MYKRYQKVLLQGSLSSSSSSSSEVEEDVSSEGEGSHSPPEEAKPKLVDLPARDEAVESLGTRLPPPPGPRPALRDYIPVCF